MTSPVVSLVVAASLNGVIGRDGDMPWRLGTDLGRFKRITLGKAMIMGRRTFDSIGRALPGRHTIVVTRDRNWSARGVTVVHDLGQAFREAERWSGDQGTSEVCVVGGGQIYAQALDRARIVRRTVVKAEIAGDTVFPPLDRRWVRRSVAPVPEGPRDDHATVFEVWMKTSS